MFQLLCFIESVFFFLVQVDVVVVGGGIIGVFVVYYLVKCGVLVVVVEKGCIGVEQLSCNWGWC